MLRYPVRTALIAGAIVAASVAGANTGVINAVVPTF